MAACAGAGTNTATSAAMKTAARKRGPTARAMQRLLWFVWYMLVPLPTIDLRRSRRRRRRARCRFRFGYVRRFRRVCRRRRRARVSRRIGLDAAHPLATPPRRGAARDERRRDPPIPRHPTTARGNRAAAQREPAFERAQPHTVRFREPVEGGADQALQCFVSRCHSVYRVAPNVLAASPVPRRIAAVPFLPAPPAPGRFPCATGLSNNEAAAGFARARARLLAAPGGVG